MRQLLAPAIFSIFTAALAVAIVHGIVLPFLSYGIAPTT
jgi:hypothetical protein